MGKNSDRGLQIVGHISAEAKFQTPSESTIPSERALTGQHFEHRLFPVTSNFILPRKIQPSEWKSLVHVRMQNSRRSASDTWQAFQGQ